MQVETASHPVISRTAAMASTRARTYVSRSQWLCAAGRIAPADDKNLKLIFDQIVDDALALGERSKM